VDSEERDVRIVGDRVVLRSVAEDDLAALERVMACPGVRAWWWDFEIGRFAAELHDPDVYALVIELDGEVLGYMQYSEAASLAYHFASIDLSLHDDFQGRGLGRDAVRTLARYLFDVRGHHRLTIDPALANERAIRCYESVGFRRVGVMREYERGADGTWHDGLFMELLASDLPEVQVRAESR
jgi:aminoglycoside 6'-N-acetyltransferase